MQASLNPRKFPVEFRKTDISGYDEEEKLLFKQNVLNNPTLPINVQLVQYIASFGPDPEVLKKRKEQEAEDAAAADGGSGGVDG